jgi:hypothetical protein
MGQGGGDVSSMGLNRLGYLGAALQDAGDGGRGQRVAQFMERAQQAQAKQKLEAVNKAVRDAYSTGDMNKVRQALVEAASNGADISHITKALEFGQESYDTTPIRDANGNAIIIGKSGNTKQLPGIQLPDPKALTPYQQAEIENMQAGRQFQQQQFGETQRHNRASEGAALRGGVPSGYRISPDGRNLEYIPGGPADPVRGAGKKAPTEDQNKNSQLYTRAKQQLSILVGDGKGNRGTFDSLSGIGSQIGSAVPGTTFFTSNDYQRADGALRDIAASYLYSVSGATANPGEVQNLVMTIRPKIGDSPQTIADKKARLSQMVDSIKLRAQPGIQVPEVAPDQAASNSGWTVKRR